VKGVRLHDLRHFFATQSLAEGHAVTTVSGALGHRDSATTLKIYAHPDEVAMSSLPGWVDQALGLTPELGA
jgi:integrase